MLSRYGSCQPLARIRHRRSESNNGIPSTTDLDLCEACLNRPFGSDASPSYAKAWASSHAGNVSFEYTRSAHELRGSAEKGCRWCGLIVNAIISADSMDVSMRALDAYNGSDGVSEDEDGEDNDGPDDEQESIDSGNEANEPGSKEDEADFDVNELQAMSYANLVQDFIDADMDLTESRPESAADSVLDKFGQCEIMVSYVHEESGMQSGFNTLEVVVNVHMTDLTDSSHEMLGENAVCIFGRLHAASDDPAGEPVSSRPCELNLGSNTSFRQAQEWLTACRKHETCSAPRLATAFTPTRVVDISNPNKPMLYPTSLASDNFEYAALSYTWGIEQTYTTTKESIDEKLRGLDLQNLPKTILDAMEVCGRLGLRYLWVDSLCIIQNSEEDKRREISQLRLIFRHATLTIAAAKAATVNDGFLSEAHPLYFMEPFKIPFQCPDEQIGTAWVSVPRFYRPRDDPWNSRAWTLEEQLLSPRVLIYSYDGLKWLCKTALWETSNPINHPLPFLELPRASDVSHDSQEGEGVDMRQRWFEILEEYTERSVTHERDKLVAFAAIAEEFHRIWGGVYLAGLWEASLVEDLLWHRDVTSAFRPWLTLAPRPAKYRAPSWSWAAVEGKTLGPYGDGQKRSPLHFKILDCSVDLKSKLLPFGPLVAAVLKIEGPLGTGYWRPSNDPTADRCDGVIIHSPDDTKSGAVANVSIDAVEPALFPGAAVLCLPVAQIKHPSAALYPIEGLILLATDEGQYRRVGFFSECRAFDWINTFKLKRISIV